MNEKNHRSLLQGIARKAMLEKEFLIDFPAAALATINGLPEIPVKITDPVRDLRELAWCSIDNDDTEDLDQLTVAINMPSGAVKILVAIADVDESVNKQSAFEEHANHNTTSVYTSALIFPMLPERFSTDLTSLKYHSDRFAIIIEFTISENGSMQNEDIYRAIVNNKAKLAYNSVGAWLDDGGPMPKPIGSVNDLDKNIQLQNSIAKKLKSLRAQNGALYLETIEARPVFNGDEVSKLEEEKKNVAKDIIQEFMISANGVTARFLKVRKFPSLRRIVRRPKRWDRIVLLASEWKYNLPAEPDSKALDQFLMKMKASNPDRFPDLSLSVIKLLGSGEYVVEGIGETSEGHFGLAVKEYTHSTAPNRRYPDLITQRLLKATLSGKPIPYSMDELGTIATHCTFMEDQAKKVERQVEKSTAALLLESSIGKQFDGIITGVSDKGTWLRIFNPPIEGKLVSGFEGMDVGDRIHVQLVRTDIERGFIDFKKAG